MNAPYRKYRDADVEANLHRATRITYAYVREYEGSFEFLCGCKRKVTAGETLPIPMIRGILNCMLCDTKMKFEDLIPFAPKQTSPFAANSPTFVPRYVKLATIWNKECGRSKHPRAHKIHYVAIDSTIEFDTVNKTYKPRVHWCCTTNWSMPRDIEHSIILMTKEEADDYVREHDNVSWCKQCVQAHSAGK